MSNQVPEHATSSLLSKETLINEARTLVNATNSYTLRQQVRDLLTALADEVDRLREVEAENSKLKIIVDVGTNDDPGTALSKLHKIQYQAVETFHRRAVEAVRAHVNKLNADIWRGDNEGADYVAARRDGAAEAAQLLESLPVVKEKA